MACTVVPPVIAHHGTTCSTAGCRSGDPVMTQAGMPGRRPHTRSPMRPVPPNSARLIILALVACVSGYVATRRSRRHRLVRTTRCRRSRPRCRSARSRRPGRGGCQPSRVHMPPVIQARLRRLFRKLQSGLAASWRPDWRQPNFFSQFFCPAKKRWDPVIQVRFGFREFKKLRRSRAASDVTIKSNGT